MPVYALPRAFLVDLVPTWRTTHLTSLTLLGAAWLTRRSLGLSELARAYPARSRTPCARSSCGASSRTRLDLAAQTPFLRRACAEATTPPLRRPTRQFGGVWDA